MESKSIVKKKKQHSIWIKYAVTYMLIVAVPLFAFSAFFNIYQGARTQRDIEAEMEQTISQIQSDFDQLVAQMFRLSAQLSKNRDFRSLSAADYNYGTRTAVCQSLLASATASTIFSNISYYTQALGDVVFTTTGTCSPLYYRMFHDEQADQWRMLDQMDVQKFSRRWLPASKAASDYVDLVDALCYCQAMTNLPNSFLIFEITENDFSRLLPHLPSDSEVYLFAGDTMLYPFRAEEKKSSALYPDGPMQLEDGRYQYVKSSDATGITYVYISRASELGAIAHATLNVFMVITSVVSMVCFLLVLIISGRHAKPIDQMVDLTSDMVLDDEKGLSRVQTAVRQWQSRSQELAEIRQDVMREQVLIRLVRGKYHDENDAEENLRRVDIRLNKKYRMILLMQAGKESKAELLQEMLACLRKKHDVHGFSYAEHSVFVLMLGMDTPDGAALSEELSAIVTMPEFRRYDVHFSIGGIFTDFKGAEKSYMQALSARRRDSDVPIAIFNESGSDELFYPKDELRALSIALAQRDKNSVALLYDTLMNLVSQNSHSYFYSISILCEMINLYLQTQSKPVHGNETYSSLLKSLRISDMDDMLECLRQLQMQALQSMTREELSSSKIEMTGVANYIYACSELDTLTVSTVAECFGMNVSTLSHRFKEQMGCNISDYIMTCKINHACILLRTTDETVNTIAQRLGYSQYTSFVRTFKKLKGVTPMAYRDECRKENDAAQKA